MLTCLFQCRLFSKKLENDGIHDATYTLSETSSAFCFSTAVLEFSVYLQAKR